MIKKLSVSRWVVLLMTICLIFAGLCMMKPQCAWAQTETNAVETVAGQSPEDRVHIEVVNDTVAVEEQAVPQADIDLDQSVSRSGQVSLGLLFGCIAAAVILFVFSRNNKLKAQRMELADQKSQDSLEDIVPFQ